MAFYRSVIILEVLHDEPLPYDWDLETIHIMTEEGPAVGQNLAVITTEIDAPAMAQFLTLAGSDPGFFNLDDEGAALDWDIGLP